MKKIIVFLSALTFFCFFSCQTAQIQENNPEAPASVRRGPAEITEPESVYEIGANETKIFIKTDIPGANVYLNKIYQGKTPLEIEGLIPGYYLLKVEREAVRAAYDEIIVEENCLIEVEKGQAQNYYFGETKQK